MCTALIASIRCAASRFAGANGESGQGRPESGPEIGTVFRPQEGDRIRKFNRIRDRIPGSKKPGQPSAVGPFLGSPMPLRVQLTPAPPETWLFLKIVEGVRKALWLRPELETAHSTFKQLAEEDEADAGAPVGHQQPTEDLVVRQQ